jgi:hypothetical protein
VLGPFYQLTRAQLPDCWALHPPAVIELVWLRRAYVAAHAPDAPPSAAGEWHTRWRRDALTNIVAAIPTTWCRPGEHYLHEHDRDRHYRDPDRPAGPPAPDQDQPTPGRRPGPADLRIGLVGEITSDDVHATAHRAARREVDVQLGGALPGIEQHIHAAGFHQKAADREVEAAVAVELGLMTGPVGVLEVRRRNLADSVAQRMHANVADLEHARSAHGEAE